ncbi:Multidrug resistance-associated protein 1 [Pseudolycoriella hygida]|uniref:ABC-type glutathione-S-conjugate transporter n=1 Tax=Pseudolycoriella hygida TaxID=35572 RepID=A0A9Q0NHQ7_9DIPT|nr:Multidrug resistance-associated protein 1 [Pseudolycoriella hygida]
MINRNFCPDPFWNQSVTWVYDNPDFTECFKQTIAAWIPCGFFIFFLPFDLHCRFKSRYADIPWSSLNISKFVTLMLLICVTLYEMGLMLGLRDAVDVDIYDSQIVSASLKAITFIFVGFLQAIHKVKGQATSGLLFLFWLILVIFAIPQLLSGIQNNNDDNSTAWAELQFINHIIYFTLISVLLLLNCFADKEPRISTYAKTTVNKTSPEHRSSFLNQMFFLWFSPIMRIGYRRPLTEDDLFDIPPENTSRELVPTFDKYFAHSIERKRWRRNFMSKLWHLLHSSLGKCSKNRKKFELGGDRANTQVKTDSSVIQAMIKAHGKPFFFASSLQFILIFLLFVRPFLLDELMNFISVADTAPVWQGLVLTFCLFFVTLISAVVNDQYVYITKLTGLRVKTTLMSALYGKALRISVFVKKGTTLGEIFNLMSVDALRFDSVTYYINDVWSCPIVIAISICLLYRTLGVAVFPGLAVMILMIPLSGVIYSQIERLQEKQMNVKDERIKSMNEILSGMKVLKLYAWEPRFEDHISNARDEELNIMKKIVFVSAGSHFLWEFAPPLVSFVSYFTFVHTGGEFTPNVAFVSVTLFSILQYPMAMFPMVLSYVIQFLVSLKRINKFMNSEEISPHNVTHNPSENALSIENGNFSWGGESLTLKNINIQVKKEKLVALVGPVGCGKTSLLSALLGEMEKINGTVNVDGRIAYVPQQAWVQNATLQDNILFGRPLNEEFYKKVIHACALNADLEVLPGGDQTEIGERGINLSGGQKQRVALARAVYSEADIYLLDDPLSAVDSHVGKHIFNNVFDDNTGLLRGKCRLLVTHSVVYLPKVSEIVVMVNGEITECGSYRELLVHKGAFAKYLIQHLQENDCSAGNHPICYDNTSENFISHNSVGKVGRIEEKDVEKSKGYTEIADNGNDEKHMSRLIEEEEAASGNVGMGVYIRYCKTIGTIVWIAATVFCAVKTVSAVYSNIWLSKWCTDRRVTNSNDVSKNNTYIAVYASLISTQSVSLVAVSIVLGLGSLRVSRDLHNRLLHNIMRMGMSFFDKTPSGRILNRFSNDINVIDNEIPDNVKFWLVMGFNVISILVVICYSTPWFLIVVVPIVAAYYFVQVFFISTSRQLKRLKSITLSPVYNHFRETINGQSSIRAFGEANRFIVENYSRVDHNQAIAYNGIVALGWLFVRLEVLGAVVVLFASLFAVLARHSLDPATVGLSISYALRMSKCLSYFVNMSSQLETSIVAIERVNEYSNCQQEAPWKTVPVDPTWPQKGVVKFENFQVRYREGLDLVLKGINFTVNSQEKIGIVGRTGAGKSSLTLCLFRIIEAAEGKIVIDDINIAEIGLHSLRSQLTIIPQDPVLFNGSLRMNIDPFNSYTDDAIWIALGQSHLKTFVEELSEGLDYKIAEGGENLSVGQRQLVCLARALLRKTKVLILDEATAAIDFETDELIQKTIRTQFRDCTILTIAHRLNTIMDSDRVIVLDEGTIAEYDTPKALLENENSIFYGMAKEAGITSFENVAEA